MPRLWFDVERRYKTILTLPPMARTWLWFDVERRYKTIYTEKKEMRRWLWFDVERRYKTIAQRGENLATGCGLM